MICYDFINEYIRNTIKTDKGFLLELRRYAENHNIPIVQPETAKLLEVLCSIINPEKILEIGTALGYSALVMASSLQNKGNIDTIELSEDIAEKAKTNIRQAGYENAINVIVGDAFEVLPCLEKKYDLIFLDGPKGHYLEFLPEILRILNTGAVLITDNVLYKGMVASDDLIVKRKNTIVRRMRDYLNTICDMEDFNTSIIPIGDGVALSYKKHIS